MPYAVEVEGGPLLLPGKGDVVRAWHRGSGAFVDMPELGAGIGTIPGGDMIGHIDGDLWFLGRDGASPKGSFVLYKRRAHATWERVESWEGHVDIEPFTPTSILVKVAPPRGQPRFVVLGDAPLPKPPEMRPTARPCSPHYDDAGFAALSNGAVVAGDACQARWAPGSTRPVVERPFGGAVVSIGRESATSAVALGDNPPAGALIARWDGSVWSPVDTTQLGATHVKAEGRTADGATWIIGERDGAEPVLFRQSAGRSDWDRIGWPALDPNEVQGKNSGASRLTVVDGELWVRVEYVPRLGERPSFGIFTTAHVKHAVAIP